MSRALNPMPRNWPEAETALDNLKTAAVAYIQARREYHQATTKDRFQAGVEYHEYMARLADFRESHREWKRVFRIMDQGRQL